MVNKTNDRNLFAAFAMSALIQQESGFEQNEDGIIEVDAADYISENAFAIADAMMRRGKKKK